MSVISDPRFNHTTLSTDMVGCETMPSARFSWAAVFAGLATAVAINIILAEAWIGIGLMLVDSDSHSGTVIISSAIAWVISACIALFAGGWVAGRVGSSNDCTVGVLQGAGVWATGSVVGILLAMSAAGALVSGSVHVVGKGLEAAGKAAGGGATAVAQIVAPNIDGIKKELTDAVGRRSEAVTSGSTATAPTAEQTAAFDNRLANSSRLSELMMGHFSTTDKRTQTDAERAELVALIGSEAGISKESATKALEQWDRVWTASVDKWKMAKDEAMNAAEKTRKVTAQAACWSVIAMALGALGAIGGGAYGVACRNSRFDGKYYGKVSDSTVQSAP